MKKLRIILIALFVMVAVVLAIGSVAVAAGSNNLTITFKWPYSGLQTQYEVNRQYRVPKIYQSGDSSYARSIYCVKGGVGFGDYDGENYGPVNYTQIGEMHRDVDTILAGNGGNLGLTAYNSQITKNSDVEVKFSKLTKQVNIYNAILWIADNAYIPTEQNNYDPVEYKNLLLDRIGMAKDESKRALITDDDIEAVQQLAIWFFANYFEHGSSVLSIDVLRPFQSGLVQRSDTVSNQARLDNRSYIDAKLDDLYQYFVKGAMNNSDSYGKGSTRELDDISALKFDRNVIFDYVGTRYDEDEDEDIPNMFEEIIYGPIKISGPAGTTFDDDDIYFLDKDGVRIDHYNYWDAAETEVTEVYYFTTKSGNDYVRVESGELQTNVEYYVCLHKIFDKRFYGGLLFPNGVTVNGRTEAYDFSELSAGLSSSYITSKVYYLSTNSNSNQPLIEIEKDKITVTDDIAPKSAPLEGRFTLQLAKVKKGTDEILENARFKLEMGTWNNQTKSIDVTKVIIDESDDTSLLGKLDLIGGRNGANGKITADGADGTYKPGTYYFKLTETQAPQGYFAINKAINIKVVIDEYDDDIDNFPVTAYLLDDNGNEVTQISGLSRIGVNSNTISLVVEDDKENFDLSLRKFITKINETDLTGTSSRVPVLDTRPLEDNDPQTTTARYEHSKDVLTLKRGDIITYTIRVYNEGNVDGKVTQITDYLPAGLELVDEENDIWQTSGNAIIDGKTVKKITTDALKDITLKAYDPNKHDGDASVWQKAGEDKNNQAMGSTGLYYLDVQVVCKITDDVQNGDIIKNIAEITNREGGRDIDNDRLVTWDNEHHPGDEDNGGYTPGEEDDDDFEQVTVDEVFDLALRKYIISVDGEALTGNDSRVPNENPDISPLNNGYSTANYKHRKDPVEVKAGSEIVYRIQTYNEGNMDGYVFVIKDYLPDNVTFIPNADFISKADFNALTEETAASVTAKYVYEFDNNTKLLTVEAYSNPFLKGGLVPSLWELNAFDGSTVDSKYIDLTFKVNNDFVPTEDTILTNVATMLYGTSLIPSQMYAIKDRDSNRTGEEFNVPGQDKLVSEDELAYYGDTNNKRELDDSTYFYKGQQDDDDFEKIIVKGIRFDLSLRKFISKINGIELQGNDSRVPLIDIRPLEDNDPQTTTAKYIHPKNVLTLKRGDKITYTLRVYNEGNVDGKVTEITDYLPKGLSLATEGNEGWVAGEQITLSDGTKVTPIKKQVDLELPKYDPDKTSGDLSVWQKAEDGKGTTGLYYKDVTVVCIINDEAEENKAIKNVAEITKYEGGKDIDSDEENVFEDLTHTEKPEDNGYFPGEEDDDDYEKIQIKTAKLDLALRKYITGLEDKNGITKATLNKDGESATRGTRYEVTPLKTGHDTAEYYHRKDPVVVENGDIVTYTIKVFNEGAKDGYVTEIKDILPEHLDFIEPTASINNEFVKEGQSSETAKFTYSVNDGVLVIKPISGKEAGTVFKKLSHFDATGTTLDFGEISFKCRVNETAGKDNKVLTNVAEIKGAKDDEGNIITTIEDERDSAPDTMERPSDLPGYKGKQTNPNDLTRNDNYYEGQQDDDDFEKLIILGKKFDLSLRKYITSVNGEDVEESREPGLDMTQFEAGNATTAIYKHPKSQITVKQGDIVTYKIRVYNEGERDGYVTKITDYLPEGLGLIVGYKTNVKNGWSIAQGTSSQRLGDLKDVYEKAKGKLQLSDFTGAEQVTSLENVQIVKGKAAISTSILQDNLIKAYDNGKTSKEGEEKWQGALQGKGTTGLYYQEVEVVCIVLSPNTYNGELRNIAAITGAKDVNGVEIVNPGDDRDSQPKEINTDNYHNPTEQNGYWPGEEDDDDFEPLVLQYFDLALRKFITAVNNKELKDAKSREPKLSIDETTGNIKYTHPKEESPVDVLCNDEVTYTLRVYNEGSRAGYADLVADDIPEGLEFLPENATNKEYRWVMYRELTDIENKEYQNYLNGNGTPDIETLLNDVITIGEKNYVKTTDAKKASIIQTDYLSKIQGASRMKDGDTKNPALLLPFNSANPLSNDNPEHADIKVVFKVTVPNNSQRVIVNSAQITHDLDERGREVDDEDSIPGKWNEGEDDQDKEYIKVKSFDLSLYKWVTKTIVTVDGKTTTTDTGFKPNIGKTENITGMEIRQNSEKEPIATVILDKKKLGSTSVKFVYKIMVMNEGEIAGSATEITDYIPQGLEFNAEDNAAFGWEADGEGKVKTRCLDGIVLQPGESATIEIVFRWINSKDNLNLKTNIAEITEDYNESDTPDIDSTPDNLHDGYDKEQEDDDDYALVILQIETGSAPTYIALTLSVLVILGAGTFLIKKYVI